MNSDGLLTEMEDIAVVMYETFLLSQNDDNAVDIKSHSFYCSDLYMINPYPNNKFKTQFTAFSPFPTMFGKAFFFRVVKSRDCVIKS